MLQSLSSEDVAPLTAKLPLELRGRIGEFIRSMFKVGCHCMFKVGCHCMFKVGFIGSVFKMGCHCWGQGDFGGRMHAARLRHPC